MPSDEAAASATERTAMTIATTITSATTATTTTATTTAPTTVGNNNSNNNNDNKAITAMIKTRVTTKKQRHFCLLLFPGLLMKHDMKAAMLFIPIKFATGVVCVRGCGCTSCCYYSCCCSHSYGSDDGHHRCANVCMQDTFR